MNGIAFFSSSKKKTALLLAAASVALMTVNFSNPQTPRNKMKVEIWSDVACPFCYIGKRKFEDALSKFEHREDIEVVWKSYILTPNLVTDASKTLYQSLAETKGWTEDYARQAGENVSRMAAMAGLKYNMDRAIPANTLRAHRMLQAAKEAGKGSELKERLLKAYFVDGLNVDAPEVLTALARQAGLSDEQLNAGLDDPRFETAVSRDLAEANQVGVTGVPFFVFDRKTAVSGAQESATFMKALQNAHADFAKVQKN